jgi:glycosyltransferase involved in cell wall biosynthesis
MRIGVIVDNDLNDDKRVLREIEVLRGSDYEIFVLCYGFKGRNYQKIQEISVTRIKISKRIKDYLFFFLNTIPAYEWFWSSSIRNFIRTNHIDCLHVHDLYMAEASRSGIRKSGKNIPMILDLHENYSYAVTTYNWTRGVLRRLISQPRKWLVKEKKLLSYPKRIIVLSDEFRDHLLSRYNSLSASDFCAFPNVPSLEQVQKFQVKKELIPFVKKAPVLLYFGVVAERRGIFNSLDAFREVIGKDYDADLVIIGPVDRKDRKRFFEQIGSAELKQRVRYIPWIDVSELPTWLDFSDICLAPFLRNPQHDSGIANKIFDYMSGKRPIIASDCLPQQKLIEKYDCGIVYHDQKEFTESMIRLLNDRVLRTRLGENGYKAVISDLNLGKIKTNLINMYKGLLNN